MAYKLKGGAGAWWNRHQEELRLRGEGRVRYWPQMKALLKARFLPADYEQLLYIQFHNCAQGNKSVSDYTEEFLRLQVRCHLTENEDQQVARYINGLNEPIQERLGMQQIWSIDQAQTLALKAERYVKTKKPYKIMSYPRAENSSKNYLRKEEERPIQSKGKKVDKASTSRRNYQKQSSNPIKCYRCGEEGHVSNKCPQRKSVNTTLHNDSDEEVEEFESESDDEPELCEEEGEEVVCVVKRLLCSTMQPEETQRKKIFESKCTVNGKVCRLIIDSCSCENLVSESLVKHLNLETHDHPSPYTIGWLKKGVKIKITKQCWLPFSLGKHYRSNVLCDVVDMDASHVLLGRPWQYDVDTTHKGKDNWYSFIWNKRKIVILPNKVPNKTSEEGEKTMLAIAENYKEFSSDLKESKLCTALVVKGEEQPIEEIPSEMQSILSEYQTILGEPQHLPPMRDIQHRIDFVPGATLPNLPHYRMSPKEHAILKEKVEDLLQKGHIRESISPCAVPTLLTPKKDGSW